MAGELELGRARALEAERAAALRESARQVAHELKNPLTPIRFAVERSAARRAARSSPRRSKCSRSSRSASRRWRAASRNSDDCPKDRAPRWTSASWRDTRRARRFRPELDVQRRRRRRRADDPGAPRCAGARAVERDAQRGRRVQRDGGNVGVRVRRVGARTRARRGRDRRVATPDAASRRSNWRASGTRTSRPSPAAPGSDSRSRARPCSRTTAP